MHLWNLITKQEGTFVENTFHLSTTFNAGRVGFFPEAECLGLFVEASRDASESMVSLVLVALCKLCKSGSGTDTPWQVRDDGVIGGQGWHGFSRRSKPGEFFPKQTLAFEAFFRHRKDGKTDMIFGLSISGFATEGHLYLGLGEPKHGIFKQHPNAMGDAPPKKELYHWMAVRAHGRKTACK